MENIFREDRTINIGPTLASMTSSGKETKGEQFIIASNRSDTDAQTEEDITDDGSSAWCVRIYIVLQILL